MTARMLCPFPVGSIWLDASGSDPSELWAGTAWRKVAGGTFLAAAGGSGDYVLGNTGGAAGVTLTAAQSAMPPHSHGKGTLAVSSSGAHGHTLTTKIANIRASGNLGMPWYQETSSRTTVTTTSGSDGGHAHPSSSFTGSVAEAGLAEAAEAHENRPPYLAVNMWKRTG